MCVVRYVDYIFGIDMSKITVSDSCPDHYNAELDRGSTHPTGSPASSVTGTT
ncbi:MAG: hypothetical protein AB9861_00515 [Methanosarcina sp.]